MANNRGSYPYSLGNFRLHSSSFPSVGQRDDTNLSRTTLQFPDGSTTYAHGIFFFPANVLTADAVIWLGWTSSNNSGNARWGVNYAYIADGSPFNSGATSTVFADSAADATARDWVRQALQPNTGGGNTNRMMHFSISREGGHANDTLGGSATADLEAVTIEFQIDPTIRKRYGWAPSQAFTIPAASGATRGQGNNANLNRPEILLLRNAQTDFVDVEFEIPSVYSGNLKTTLVESAVSATGAFVWRIDAAKVSPGDNNDPTFTQGTQFTSAAHGATDTVRFDLERACPITVSPGDKVIFRINRLGSDGSDANTGDAAVIGLGIVYDILIRNPASTQIDPGSCTSPATGGCTIQQRARTNRSYNVATFANGAAQALDILLESSRQVQSSTGQLTFKWESASTGNAKFRVDYAYGDSGAASDPSLTTGTAFVETSGGANECNQTVPVTIATGAGGLYLTNIRILRLANDAADTIEDEVDITSILWNHTPVAA